MFSVLERACDLTVDEFDYPDAEHVEEGPFRPHRRTHTEDFSSEDSRTKDSWVLTELAPSGPTVIDIISSFKTYVACDI